MSTAARLEFFPDGDHGIRVRQVFAVIISQIVDQRFRGLGLLRAVITDRAQRVKQEMRIDLGLQRLDFRLLHQVRFFFDVMERQLCRNHGPDTVDQRFFHRRDPVIHNMAGAKVAELSLIVIKRHHQTGPDHIQLFGGDGEIAFKKLCEIVFQKRDKWAFCTVRSKTQNFIHGGNGHKVEGFRILDNNIDGLGSAFFIQAVLQKGKGAVRDL